MHVQGIAKNVSGKEREEEREVRRHGQRGSRDGEDMSGFIEHRHAWLLLRVKWAEE